MNKIKILDAYLVYESNVGNEEQRKQLINNLYEIRKKQDSLDFANINCYKNNLNDIPVWLQESLKQLVYKSYNIYLDDPIFNNNSQEFKYFCWFNINSKNSRNVLHTHKENHLTCVYYLQGFNTGSLRLLNPANISTECKPFPPWTKEIVIQPNDGDFFMWPSWVPHEVEPNYSNNDRINIAFNINFIKK